MSAAFPNMVFSLRGRMAGEADYVRRIWEQYARNPVVVTDRIDLKYTFIVFPEHWEIGEIMLVSNLPTHFCSRSKRIGGRR